MAVDSNVSPGFVSRHVGPREADVAKMLTALGLSSLEELVEQTVPADIRLDRALAIEPAASEQAALEELRALASRNRLVKSHLGMGYHDTFTPPVLQRNVLENPGWYTQYTPYQAEISQGRLEALLNFQTMVCDLTALPVANASLLDEATAAAEAMHVMYDAASDPAARTLLVSDRCHPQTLSVVRTRAEALELPVVVADPARFDFQDPATRPFGVVLQYPDTDGALHDPREVIARAHAAGALVALGADLLALTLLAAPGELGADLAYGSAQRFGVPLGFGGPHAAFFAARAELVRKLPGRIIGVSRDAHGKPALRMALQTREQHIRREKATSNICTAQALLAIVAGGYAVWHGPDGLRAIASRAHGLTSALAAGVRGVGLGVASEHFFDTLRVTGDAARLARAYERALERGHLLRRYEDGSLGVALDETTTTADVDALLEVFADGRPRGAAAELVARAGYSLPTGLVRTSAFLGHPVFHAHRSETEMLRYLRLLESRDLSLVHAMIPLGSCTMKLNASAEMMPVTWPEFGRLHPFAPPELAAGYRALFADLERWLAEITGFSAVSLQPNAGSQGEYAGLLTIRAYHDARGETQRRVCLIPASAHGTNPASAVMAGLEVKVVRTDARGNVDLEDLERLAREHAPRLAALMITYPSTHGVFEESIRRITAIVHEHGGQVYLDGANMNAQVGLCRPGDYGADVCHLNLHKTFAIPHGGGGPGMGPIAVAPHLAPYLPRHPIAASDGAPGSGAIAAAPWGSASVLVISWAYIRMMGPDGLRRASAVAILAANYLAHELREEFAVVYAGARGRVAHECILDVRPFKATSGVEVEDVAKRLMDYGFHAPTMSFPIPGTLMIEPTESEPLHELERFVEAMRCIREEIRAVEAGVWPRGDNPLENAPHTAQAVCATEWPHPYSREVAAFPTRATRERKFWPAVGRVDNAAGDRKLVCTCPPIEDYAAR
ncbi:MAG: aminomethyl-transferring glycine dehydrogenase [Polyangiaceae bacterium]|nr:aminomethyl-transferring glycine dehydrogenase [Polyangiaceae bacterium]